MAIYREYKYKKLINDLPKLRYVYLKAVLKTRWITLILDFLFPLFLLIFWTGFSEDNEPTYKTISRIILFFYLVIGSISFLMTIIDTSCCLVMWKRKFEKVLLPLAKINDDEYKDVFIKTLLDTPMLYSLNTNFTNPNFVDSISIVMGLKYRRFFWVFFIPLSYGFGNTMFISQFLQSSWDFWADLFTNRYFFRKEKITIDKEEYTSFRKFRSSSDHKAFQIVKTLLEREK